uniref:Immunoglobulin I-set domain-containing protein n=1 Tax=Globodera rostochiensis TaxID=31243 RepID=A0A914HE35_GLORO
MSSYYSHDSPRATFIPTTRKGPSAELQLIGREGIMPIGGKIKVFSKPRPPPIIDLTLFGGGMGPKRFYKREKESIPEFISSEEDQWHSAGDNIVIKVRYKGHPEPLVQWFKGEQQLQGSRRLVITADGSYSEMAIFDAQRSDGERGCHVFIREGGPSGTAGSGALRAYRSVLYTPVQRYSRF